MSISYTTLVSRLRARGNPMKARSMRSFFKTGKGEYGEGDIFLGISVPEQRAIASDFVDLPLSDIEKLLSSPIHELRFTALEILVMKYERGDPHSVDFYLSHTAGINNWDLVDTSARYILGNYLLGKDCSILYTLARSENMWERRIAIVSTHEFIVHGEYTHTHALARILLKDTEPLIHKALGWMLRETGKYISKDILVEFLKDHAHEMPRISLSYALEHFSKKEREVYMKRKHPRMRGW